MRIPILLWLALLLVNCIAGSLPADQRPRLIVLTDIGGDPDDTQSLVRLMVYANEFEIEGLIASASGTPGELKEKVTKPELIREVVKAYGEVQNNLARHASGYPPAEQLLARIKSGNPNRGLEAIGKEHDTDGSQWIIRVVDSADERPVNIAVWGGQTDLAQALWRVREDRGDDGATTFISQLRVHDIADQDGIQHWIYENFPDLFYVLNKAASGKDKRASVFRGMYLGGDESLTSREWIDRHVRNGHGPLGALYPPKTYTSPNPHGALKEGDTPSWLYFLPNGLSDPAEPSWGGWGGRFQAAERGLYRDSQDTAGKATDARATVWRWRPAFQNDFAARMDWCVKPPGEANHNPVVVINGDRSRDVITLTAAAGTSVALSAAGTSDPDVHVIAYKWWTYAEAGSYHGDVVIADSTRRTSTLAISADSTGKSIHVILEATDDGQPPLTSFRRLVLNVE